MHKSEGGVVKKLSDRIEALECHLVLPDSNAGPKLFRVKPWDFLNTTSQKWEVLLLWVHRILSGYFLGLSPRRISGSFDTPGLIDQCITVAWHVGIKSLIFQGAIGRRVLNILSKKAVGLQGKAGVVRRRKSSWLLPPFSSSQISLSVPTTLKTTNRGILSIILSNLTAISSIAMNTSTAATEKGHSALENAAERNDRAIDQDRDTFLPRPSDDPNDPLNFPLWLKVGQFNSSSL